MSIKTQDKIINQCKSWADFVNFQDIQINTTQKGDLFERLVQLYLSTSPQYKSKLSNIWWPKYEELPKGVASYLNLSFPDEGIDLIAQTTNGEYWPIQAKYESNTEGAKQKSNLTTFANASFNYGENMHLGLVAHTKSKPIRKRKLLESEKKGNKIIELGLSHWLELDDDDWAAIKSKVSGEIYKPEKLTPRDHQKIAIKKAKNHFIKNKNNNGKLIMPCASGKSLTAYWIARELEAKTIIVAVPSLSLIKQTIKDWTREYIADNYQPEWICICSDKSTGELDQDNDDFVKDIYDVGLPVTTDKNDISKFLSNNTKSPKIIFTTYMSSKVLAEAVKKNNHIIDFCIFDEAHKTAGRKNKRSAALLSNRNIKIKKRLFMTATERYLSGTDKSERVNSMDNESVYGKCFHKLTFKEAIKEKIICDYKIITMTISKSEIDELVDEHKFVINEDGESFIDAATLATGIALDKTITNYNVKHAITFHKSIKSAKSFKNQQIHLSKKGVTSSEPEYSHISSKLSTGERSKVISNFITANTSVITNAKCLTEGVDIPAIDCVVFASPKQSVVDIVQAAGRAMRPNHKSGKKFGYILLPIVVPENMEFEIFATSTEFNVIAKQLAALSTQDERIAEYFRLIEAGTKPTGDILEIVGSVPIGMDINFKEFASAIETKIWNKVGKINWRPFMEAREFIRSKGFNSQGEFKKYSTDGLRPSDIPSNPNVIYNEWAGWPDWLGNGNEKIEYWGFDKSRSYVQKLKKVTSNVDWTRFSKTKEKPLNIPADVRQFYRKTGEWTNDSDFFRGDINKKEIHYLEYEDAKKTFVHPLKLTGEHAWRDFKKMHELPIDIPRTPENFYKEWAGWPDWLGTNNISNRDKSKLFLSFKKAKQWAIEQNIKGQTGWREYAKNPGFPDNIPNVPHSHYSDKGWDGYPDFLGYKTVSGPHKKFKTFIEARRYARSLNLSIRHDWQKWLKKGERPNDIPAKPDVVYKNKGWKGWSNYLRPNK